MTFETDSSPPGRPPPIRAEAEVLANLLEDGGSGRLLLAVPGWPGALPGQFLMLSAGALSLAPRTDPLLPRPMAVFRGHAAAQKSDSGRIEVLYRIAGRGTQLLSEARVGQALSLVGPLGLGFDPISATERPVLVGGGTGIASLYELAARGAKGNDRLEVVLGARTEGDLMAVEDFRVLPVRLHLTTEDGSCGIRGRTTDVVRDLLGERAEGTTLYSCGPTPMMEACAKLALETSAECRVSLENTMACGSGICLGCAVPVRSGGYSLVCRDGPVFDAREVVWEGLP